ncbi:hypothetical protein LEP1GSC065_1184 [Leptospira kirschneri serovar Sokoine str. RM1]|nr:hypothetical protein LEP1GSC065_1184 [Leptospira kirschneri serovar Sokoine str. RM1]
MFPDFVVIQVLNKQIGFILKKNSIFRLKIVKPTRCKRSFHL